MNIVNFTTPLTCMELREEAAIKNWGKQNKMCSSPPPTHLFAWCLYCYQAISAGSLIFKVQHVPDAVLKLLIQNPRVLMLEFLPKYNNNTQHLHCALQGLCVNLILEIMTTALYSRFVFSSPSRRWGDKTGKWFLPWDYLVSSGLRLDLIMYRFCL